MRISTSHTYDTSVDNLLRRQVELSDSQNRLTSGKRVARASDDPEAAARAERALASENRAVSSQRAVDATRGAMQQSESALGEALDLLQTARETVVSAGNATYTDTERLNLAQRLKGLRDQLLMVANRQGADGNYLFSAQGASFPPFVDQPPNAALPLEQTGVTFAGVPGTVRGEPGTGLPLSTDGYAAFVSARTGNGVFETRPGAGVTNATIDVGRVVNPSALVDASYDISFSVSGGVTTYSVSRTLTAGGTATVVSGAPYTSGQAINLDGMAFTIGGAPANGDQFEIKPSVAQLSAFGVLDKAIADLSAPATNSQRSQFLSHTINHIDSVMNSMQAVRAGAGDVLNRVDTENNRLLDQQLSSRTERALAEDLDMAKAISEFQLRQSGYEAALRSYSMVQKISLFQYISG
jgi:flagellar hook-associated protein 3 FlgL